MLSTLKNEKGQSAVEFALVAILLLLLVFGVLEFGRAWYRADVLKNAANIGARTCAVTKVRATAEAAAQAAIPDYSDPPTQIIVPDCADPTLASEITVTVTEAFQSQVPVLLPILQNLTLTRTATYRKEP